MGEVNKKPVIRLYLQRLTLERCHVMALPMVNPLEVMDVPASDKECVIPISAPQAKEPVILDPPNHPHSQTHGMHGQGNMCGMFGEYWD